MVKRKRNYLYVKDIPVYKKFGGIVCFSKKRYTFIVILTGLRPDGTVE